MNGVATLIKIKMGESRERALMRQITVSPGFHEMARYLERTRVDPYPRESIAAARSKERASDSSRSGIKILLKESF